VTVPPGERPRSFPASERLRTDREFREVVRKGARVHTMHYTVYRDSPGGGKRQVGISAGKRAGGAVSRNRTKRLLREFFRMHKGAFPRGTRTAIVVRKSPEGAVLSSVCAELLPALRRRWGGNEGDSPCGPDISSSAS
jgi:ribonuclease P protein component